MSVHIEIPIIGPCIIRTVGDVHCEIRSPKHRALIAILALSPLGRASRQQVQNLLWGAADYDSGNQNLRRALSDLRKHIGPQFQNLFHTTKSDIELDLSKVRFIRPIGPGPILADLNIATPAYAASPTAARLMVKNAAQGRAFFDGLNGSLPLHRSQNDTPETRAHHSARTGSYSIPPLGRRP